MQLCGVCEADQCVPSLQEGRFEGLEVFDGLGLWHGLANCGNVGREGVHGHQIWRMALLLSTKVITEA